MFMLMILQYSTYPLATSLWWQCYQRGSRQGLRAYLQGKPRYDAQRADAIPAPRVCQSLDPNVIHSVTKKTDAAGAISADSSPASGQSSVEVGCCRDAAR